MQELPAVDIRISPSLDPGAVDHLIASGQYTVDRESLLSCLDPVRAVFTSTAAVLGRLHDARKALQSDATRTSAAVDLAMDQQADKVKLQVAGKWDKTLADVNTKIRALEAELSAPINAKGSQSIATEVRSHLAGLSVSKRQTLLATAIRDGDEVTMAAVLSAPAYLSGISAEMHESLRGSWNARITPGSAERLDLYRRAGDLLMSRSALLHREFEKITGPVGKIAALRQGANRARAALEGLSA